MHHRALAHGWKRLCCTVMLTVAGFSATAQVDQELQILDQTPQSLDLRLQLLPPRIADESTLGWPWQTIGWPDLPTLPEPGRPLLPVKAQLITIPAGASVQLEVLTADFETVTGLQIAPAVASPTTSNPPRLDPTVYEVQTWFPAEWVDVGFTGRLRGLPVAQIRFHPVQYDPVTETARIARSITIRIHFDRPFDSSTASVLAVQQSDALNPFAAIYRETLLNAEQGGLR